MVNFDPTVGSEIGKQRPAVVISSDAVGRLPIKLVAPITGWQEKFSGTSGTFKSYPPPPTGSPRNPPSTRFRSEAFRWTGSEGGWDGCSMQNSRRSFTPWRP